MDRDRLTAFTVGVLAVIITIMVLEMKAPHGAGLEDLFALCPVFMSYVVSFVDVAIYWNNHHHFFQLVEAMDGAVLWANMHLLFWLSTVPFATAWMGENDFAPIPTALYLTARAGTSEAGFHKGTGGGKGTGINHALSEGGLTDVRNMCLDSFWPSRFGRVPPGRINQLDGDWGRLMGHGQDSAVRAPLTP
jgi:Endosomal/lysosomal potassium channel TMEM175